MRTLCFLHCRYGHSQVNSDLWRFDKDWNVIPEGHLPLRDSYFRPERVIREGGMEPLLRGFVYQPAQEVDSLVGRGILVAAEELRLFCRWLTT